jgi:hypothetical protein
MRILAFTAALALSLPALAASDADVAYRIESTKGPLKVKKGATARAHVEVIPRADAHVSPDAPLSVTVAAGPALKLAKSKLTRADSRETSSKGVEFDVPFTAETAGSDELKASVTFFICTEKLCERQRRDVTLAVVVE